MSRKLAMVLTLMLCAVILILAQPSETDKVIHPTSAQLSNLTEMYAESFAGATSETNHSSKLVKRSIRFDELDNGMTQSKQVVAQRRNGPEIADSVEIYRYRFRFITAATIGEYTFS